MEQLSSSNPLMITVTNITIVFAVLYCLGWVIKFIHIIDPTRKRNVVKTEPPVVSPAPPLAVPTEYSAAHPDEDEIVAVIAAAVAAYGISPSRITSIRPVGGQAWSQAGRFEALNIRSQMF